MKALEKTLLPNLSKYLDVSFYMTLKISVQIIYPTKVLVFQYHQFSHNQHGLGLTINLRTLKIYIFVGAGTHPGAGVWVLSSAKVLENILMSDSRG